MNLHTTARVTRFIFNLVFPALFIFSSSYAESPSSGTVMASQKWADQVALDVVSKIRKGHPRIFLTPERISKLRAQALSGKKPYFNLLKERMRGPQAALFYALDENKSLGLPKSRQEYGRIAADSLMQTIRENNPSTSPDDLAVLYDWAFGALTDEEKKVFVNFCKLRLGKELRIHDGKSHGYRCSPWPVGLIAILSFYGDGVDDHYAERLLIQGIRDTLLDNLAMEHVAGTDGGFADGTYYFYQLGGTFYTFLALGIATDSNFFFEHEVIAKLPNHLIYAILPFSMARIGMKNSARYFATFHDNWTLTTQEYGSVGGRLANLFAITAAEYWRRGNEARARLYTWFLNQAFGGIPWQAENPLSFVLMDWSIQPQGPKESGLPLAKALGWNEERGQIDRDRFGKKAGIGWVCMRSSWEDPDATFSIFKAEPFYYHGHMHHDSLAFMIAKGEELNLARAGNYMCWYEGGPLRSRDPGWPQMDNFFTRTVATNNLLVYDPDEKFDGWNNEGGQRFIQWEREWGRTYNGTANGNNRDLGGLIRFERTKDYVYAAADATRAYNSPLATYGGNHPKVNLVQREFVYLTSLQGKEDYFVIFDRVESVKQDFKKFWLLQLRAKPEFDGSHRVAMGSDAGGVHLSEYTSLIRVQQERAELFCKSLLPEDGNRLVRRLGGWVTTHLKKPLKASDNGPLDIEVESTEGLPDHPVVIITAQASNANREVFESFSVWPQAIHASTTSVGERICYFCDGKTPPGQKPAKLLNCIRATKSAPGFAMPEGARVIQEFRHMGIEGIDKDKDFARINYPWGYGLGYNYGDCNQYGLWRVEVSPKKASRYDHFLHVLHPTLERKGMADTQLTKSDSGNLYGAKIGGRVVIFSSRPEPLENGSYTLHSKGPMWQLLCNLVPQKSYQIIQDGKLLFVLEVSKQGTLHFESTISKSSHFQFNAVAQRSEPTQSK
jgi:hypothetical protein